MNMKVVTLRVVSDFVDSLDMPIRSDVEALVALLGQYGHALSMPYAKPIGHRLWELRRTGRPHIRVLYGFVQGHAVLVLALKKQRSSLRQKELTLARKRFEAYCDDIA